MKDKVSVIIPAYNEQRNIAKVIKLIKRNTNIEEIIVVDNNSTDKTGIIAKREGAKVIYCENQGKGYAMKAGLETSINDIVIFIDADITNYAKDLIQKLVNPIIEDRADFVKSMFNRQGGRVTELVAKPLIKIMFPDIPPFSQPLSGMIAAKKEILQKIEFEKGYGVDIGILLDMIFINARIEEVHIGTINNFSQSWKNLENMSEQVMRAIIKRNKKI